MPMAVVYKDGWLPSKPWKVLVKNNEKIGWRGGIMGPWRTKKAAQAYADEINKMIEEAGYWNESIGGCPR